jgi:alkylhydroperoxidase family enzyme
MLSMVMKSLRVTVDPSLAAPLPPQTLLASAPAQGQAPAQAPGQALGQDGAERSHPVLSTPRIPPLEPTFWTGELRVLLDPDGTGRDVAAIYRTFARHPALYGPRQELSEYIRLKATLPARAREIAILRIGALCGSDYEWAAHVRAARAAGVSDNEIRRLAVTGDAGWNAVDRAVIRGVDELYRTDDITDATWRELTRHYDTRQLLDLLVTTGGYRMVSMALNTFGVPLEENSERIPR